MARIGTVGYLNARPLSDEIDVDRHTLVLANPAEVARMLRAREVDVALVPVAAALSDDEYRVVPGHCIGADGPVASVLLVAETPPEQWTTVVLDGVSRTSVVLARLMLTRGPLAQRVRPDLVIEDGEPNSGLRRAKKTTAALVIGDAARELPERLTTRLDLALLWKSWTGLPFVFAVWAGRPELPSSVVADLKEAGAAGVARITRKYAGDDLAYLTKNLRYPLDDAALSGLRRFGALAHEAGLVPRADVELYGPPSRRLERPDTDAMLERALNGSGLPHADVVALLRQGSVAELAAAADLKRRESWPGTQVPYATSPVEGEGHARIAVGEGTEEELAARLLSLRDQPGLSSVTLVTVDVDGPYASAPNTASDLLRAVAVARLVLPGTVRLRASPATEGLGMTQASLRSGCDHAGSLDGVDPAALEHHLRAAGFEPVLEA